MNRYTLDFAAVLQIDNFFFFRQFLQTGSGSLAFEMFQKLRATKKGENLLSEDSRGKYFYIKELSLLKMYHSTYLGNISIPFKENEYTFKGDNCPSVLISFLKRGGFFSKRKELAPERACAGTQTESHKNCLTFEKWQTIYQVHQVPVNTAK